MGYINVPLKSQDNDVLLLKLRTRENLCFTLDNNFPIKRPIYLQHCLRSQSLFQVTANYIEHISN